MVKKRVKEEGSKKGMVLLTVMVILSLVVDLISLNILYNISEGSNLGGTLAGELRMSADAWACTLEWCDSEEDCDNQAEDAYEECLKNFASSDNSYPIYYLDYCTKLEIKVRRSCLNDREVCVQLCEDRYPESNDPGTPLREERAYYRYGYYETV